MIVKELVKLANTLDQKGETKLANLVDSIVKRCSEEGMDDAPDADEDGAEEKPEADDSAPDGAAAPVAAAPMTAAPDASKSWYNEGQPDLTPVDQGEYAGTMLDKRQALPGDTGSAPAAAAPVAAPATVTEEVEEVEEGSSDDADADAKEEVADKEMMYEASLTLAALANDLDQKGFSKEASLVDEILGDIKKLSK